MVVTIQNANQLMEAFRIPRSQFHQQNCEVQRIRYFSFVTCFYGPNKTNPSAFFKYRKQTPNVYCNIFGVTRWNSGSWYILQ